MPNVIISDTSCFIILSKIKELDLLFNVYGTIITTPEIVSEFGEKLPDWVQVVAVKDKSKQSILEMQVDKGESSALALALEMDNSTLILDDYRARKIAEKLKLPYTGTIGVIIKAKQQGIISAVKPLLEKIKKTDFRISEELELKILSKTNEN